MAITLTYLRDRAAELARAEGVLEEQARDFFKGRQVTVLRDPWVKRNAKGVNLAGKTLLVERATYWEGSIWLQLKHGDKTRSIQLQNVSFIREQVLVPG